MAQRDKIQSLVERALEIARRPQGVLTAKLRSRQPIHHLVGVFEAGSAIKFLRTFPATHQPACKACLSLCNVLGHATLLTPGPVLKRSVLNPYQHPLESWKWVRDRMERKIREWDLVGVALDDVFELVRRARQGGNKLSRHEYVGILKICLCIKKELSAHMSPMVALFDVVVADCGLEAAQEVLIQSAFRVAISESQIRVVCQLLGETAKSRPKVFQGEQLAASLTADFDPNRSLNLFTQFMLTSGEPPTSQVYEYMISACARNYQLLWALNVFNSITGKYRMAPSHNAYRKLISIMSARARNKDKVVTTQLCHHVLAATEKAYDGKPPLWVYSHMTKPLLYLMGTEAYHAMYERCEHVLDSMRITDENERNEVLRSAWKPDIYNKLIKIAADVGDRGLVLHMLSEMKGRGFSTNAALYQVLLQLISQPYHLSMYLPALLENMSADLTSSELEGGKLQANLTTALDKAVGAGGGEDGDTRVPGYISAAGSGLLEVTLSRFTHQNCLKHLERLSGSV